MTNQEQINEIMGKLLDLPQRPVFYEDDYPYPWKPFKSNGGTGDTPADWPQPSTPVEPTPQPVQPKLCPFRKNTYFYSWSDNAPISVEITHAEFCEEEFQPCMMGLCMFYQPFGPDGPTCGRK